MSAVTFPAEYGASGNTYTDDDDPETGLDEYGYVTRLVPMFADVVAVTDYAVAMAAAAAESLASAVLAPGTSATSTTSNTVGTGNKSFTIQTGKAFAVGQYVIVARTSAPGTTQMIGIITAHNSGTGALTVNVSSVVGSGGPFTDWTISLTAVASVSSSRTIAAAGLATGGGDLSANRTITVTAAVAADVRTMTSTSTAVTPDSLADAMEKQTLADGATVSWNANSGFNARVTLGGNRTLAAMTNPKEGMSYALEIVQDATGSRTLAFNACYDFGLSGTPVLSTAAGKVDIVFLYCYDETTPLFRASFNKAAA